MSLILYELKGRNDLRYSQFSWRARLALSHKNQPFETRAVAISDKAAIAFSGQDKVPILVDGDRAVPDSWRIAEYLEAQFPDDPSLFGGEVGHGLSRYVNCFVDRALIPELVPMLMIDVLDHLDSSDQRHLRDTIEGVFRQPLETLAAEREQRILGFRKLLDPMRATLKAQPFLSGPAPAYPDYIVFSLFQWARLVSAFQILADGDPLADWFGRVLEAQPGAACDTGSHVG